MERSGAIQRRMNQAIDQLVTAPLHIRDCARCRRVFEATFEAIGQVDNAARDFPETFPTAPNPWRVTIEALRDLRTCENWPRGI
jgi:NMD protein affecting ribosome stability and mRNA decay